METTHSKEVSCYSSSLLIKYALDKGIPSVNLFNGIESYKTILENPLEWTKANIWSVLAKNIEKGFGFEPNILETIGDEITIKQVTFFPLLFFKISPLPFIISRLPNHMENNVNKLLHTRATLNKKNDLSVFFRPLDKKRYSRQICDFNRGCTCATVKLKGYKNVTITEVACAARDPQQEFCHYRLTWNQSSNILSKIKETLIFSFRDQKTIIQHMEETHTNLQQQYNEILSIKDFYSHIMNNMSEGILWLDRDGLITFANDGFCAISKYPIADIKGKSFFNFLSKSKPYSGMEDFLKERQDNPKESMMKELVLKTKSGEKRIGLANVIWVESVHQKPGFLISIRDITDQKKIERQLHLSENRYESLYNNSPALIIGLDLDGRFIYANPSMEEQSGYSEEELVGMHFGKLVAPDAEFDVNRLFKGRLDKQERLQEVKFKTKSGEWKTIALNTYPVRDSMNMVAGVAGIGIDITETKRLNEQVVQSHRMDLLGKMAGGLAHDFKNVLNVILGYSEIIQAKTEDGNIKRQAANIHKASKRATELTKSLLTFSRGEVVKRKRFIVNNILKEVYNLCLPIMPVNVSITTDIPKKSYYVKGDSGKIHQCVLNLCINARDALSKKGGTIQLKVDLSEQEGFVRIEVQDNGPGIAPDHIERIFDPFFSTKKKGEGTGLGLSVVYGIVRAHNGFINVDSRPGEGTTFIIDLPLIVEEKNECTKKEKSIEKSLVMIVDDDDLMREFCEESLQDYGYDTIQFSSAYKSIEWYKENHSKVQLIFVDVQMPEMNGLDLIKELYNIEKDSNIIIMSGYLPSDIQNSTQRYPILEKPFTADSLSKAIDSSFTFSTSSN